MYWTISVILMVLWALGLTAGSTEGAWVHLFLAFALVSAVLGLVSGGGRGKAHPTA